MLSNSNFQIAIFQVSVIQTTPSFELGFPKCTLSLEKIFWHYKKKIEWYYYEVCNALATQLLRCQPDFTV